MRIDASALFYAKGTTNRNDIKNCKHISRMQNKRLVHTACDTCVCVRMESYKQKKERLCFSILSLCLHIFEDQILM